MGPNYHRPAVNPPPTFRGQSGPATNSFGDLAWWEVFHDEMLQRLIRVALTNNYDVRIALTRVEQARELEREARSGFFPQLNYSGAAGKGRNVGANNSPSPTGSGGSIFSAAGTASWDIDLWGRIRRLDEAARADFLASEEGRRDVMSLVVSQVAQNYFQLLALENQLEIARESTNSFGQSLKIFASRLQGGVASKLETSSAEALMDSAAATIPELDRQIIMQENQLSVLTAEFPAPVSHGKFAPMEQLFPEVPAGLPSSLLERRPDIRRAEQDLRAANARVGVAQADFFPKLSLTALFGTVSPELSAFTAGGATAWSIAAGLTGPIFQGGRLRAEHRRTLAVREQFALQYRSTTLKAFQEVSDALISRQKLGEVELQQRRAVNAYQEAVNVAIKRYQLGNAGYFEVLQEQQLLFPAENSLAQTHYNQLLNVVTLYRALGGGWQK